MFSETLQDPYNLLNSFLPLQHDLDNEQEQDQNSNKIEGSTWLLSKFEAKEAKNHFSPTVESEISWTEQVRKWRLQKTKASETRTTMK